jgi:hypothetical protein
MEEKYNREKKSVTINEPTNTPPPKVKIIERGESIVMSEEEFRERCKKGLYAGTDFSLFD